METSLEIRDRPTAASGDASGLRSLIDLGGALAGIALRPLAAGVELGLRAERELRQAALRQASATALAGLDRLLASELAAQAARRVLEGPELERAVESALDSAAMERLVVRVIDSRLLNEAVAQLLKTDELWLLVDEIARSPSVAEAITRQSVGFVDELAGGVRAQSRSADTWLESRVRNAFRRKPRIQPEDA